MWDGVPDDMRSAIMQNEIGAALAARFSNPRDLIPVPYSPYDNRRRLFHPSSLGSECDLKLVYEYRGEPHHKIGDAKGHALMDLGTAIHNALIQPAIGSVFGVDYERKMLAGDVFGAMNSPDCYIEPGMEIPAHRLLGENIEDPYEVVIGGHGDSVITLRPKGFRVLRGLVEIKSVKKELWEGKGGKKGVDVSGPPFYNRIQTEAYMMGMELDFVVFIFFQKNDALLAPMYRVPEQKNLNFIKNRVGSLREVVRKGLPDPQPTPNMMGCKMCNFTHICPKPFKGRRRRNNSATRM